jgi:hypothetical protein
MIQLTPAECRVLGVLIEKAQTTPGQYPLTLNALITGCNQKSNREPVTDLREDDVLDALDGLKAKGLAREVMLTGSRVQKFRHIAREALDIGTNELVVLAELLLRGPQTIGELRGRASRMHPLDTVDVVRNVLDLLLQNQPPLVREVPAAPGDRAPRFAQLLCPTLHRLDGPPAAAPAVSGGGGGSEGAPPLADLAPELDRRLRALELDVADLQKAVHAITHALGEPSLLRNAD